MVKKLNHNKTKLLFGNQLNNQLNKVLSSNYNDCKKIIITDENVYDLWIEDLITNTEKLHQAEIIQLPAGESTKNIEIANQVWETLADYKISRNDLIINFGGGAITDLGGFIASTFKRGVNYINIPTTLLAQVDASIGGKTGINLNEKKNLIGTFSHPDYVFIDYKYLNTLDAISKLSGFAEMLKHGLIKDKNHWGNLTKISPLNTNKLQDLIYDSVKIKQAVVESDPFEKGERKSLNFGHTVGHAYESLMLNKNIYIPHGYAVAFGMVIEAEISYQNKMLTSKALKSILNFINDKYDFSLSNIDKKDISILMELMKNDKKIYNQQINFTLLKEIGESKINCIVDEELIEKILISTIKN
jgi:3-dehydroquinate synthase